MPNIDDEWESYFQEMEEKIKKKEESLNAMTRKFADFHKFLEPEETPFLTSLGSGRNPWSPPDFCIMEKKEPQEPFFSWYQSTQDIIAEVAPDFGDEYEDDWVQYTESSGLTLLRKLAWKIGQYAYKEVPNPNYDAEKCLEWKAANVKTWKKVEWGTSDITPPPAPGVYDPEESVIVTPDGPRTIDEGQEA